MTPDGRRAVYAATSGLNSVIILAGLLHRHVRLDHPQHLLQCDFSIWYALPWLAGDHLKRAKLLRGLPRLSLAACCGMPHSRMQEFTQGDPCPDLAFPDLLRELSTRFARCADPRSGGDLASEVAAEDWYL